MFTVEQVITLTGGTGKKIAESRTNTDLIFPCIFVRLIQMLSKGGGGDGAQGPCSLLSTIDQ